MTYKHILFSMILIFGISSHGVYASEGSEKDKGEKVVAVEKAGVAEKTYKEKAKELGNRIKQGFLETSRVPRITNCIASGTQMYAGFRTPQDAEKAESITEFYLLMGEEEGLDLDDMEAVMAFLEKKLDERVAQNIEKGAGWSGFGILKGIAKCIKVGGEAYYRIRLKQALVWAYTEKVEDVEVSLDEDTASISGDEEEKPHTNNE